jgi:hypothetical protein
LIDIAVRDWRSCRIAHPDALRRPVVPARPGAVTLIAAIATGFALGTLWAVGTDDPELAEHEFDRQSRQSGWH